MNKKKLECLIDALNDSLVVVAHNPVETEYVLALREKYKQHYRRLVGRDYSKREIIIDKVIEEERA